MSTVLTSPPMNELDPGLGEGGRVFAIGANGHYLGHWVRAILARGVDPRRVVVIRDQQHCPVPVCAGLDGVMELAIEPGDLDAVIAGLQPGGRDLGCVLAWHRRVSAAVIETFAGRLLNLHYGDLPRYRGAGGGSWQVLNGETETTAYIHAMTVELDRGGILMRETEPFASNEPYPRHVKEAAARAGIRVLDRLAAQLAGGMLPLQAQDEDAAVYFPRLDTTGNGWIDFSWPSLALLRFVRAFSDPYPGASFRYHDRLYRVRRARLRNEDALHPFAAGLVVNRTDVGLHVAVCDAVVVFSEIHDAQGRLCSPEVFRVGGRLWSSAEDLLTAKMCRPSARASTQCQATSKKSSGASKPGTDQSC